MVQSSIMSNPNLSFGRRVEFRLTQGVVLRPEESQSGVTKGLVPFEPQIPDWLKEYQVEIMRGRLCIYVAEIQEWDFNRLFSFIGIGAMPFAYLSEDKLRNLPDKKDWGGYKRAVKPT